jgi:hypothetical protein
LGKPMGAPSIDWEDLREGYNQRYRTKYKTVRGVVKKIYREEKSSLKAGDILGVSCTTFLSKLKELNIPVQGKGGNNNPWGGNGKPENISVFKVIGH